MAANNFQSGGVDNNWNTPGNWSLGSVPTASDGHTATFLVGSPACTVNIAAVCNNIDFTNYTNTITMTNGITVSGNVTLGSGMTISGAGGLTINNTSSIQSNGKTFPNTLALNGNFTYTLLNHLTVTGSLNVGFTSATTHTVNGAFNLTVGGSISIGTTGFSAACIGTASFIMNGTGTINCAGNVLRNNLTFNTANTITISNLLYNTGTLTYTAGTIVTTGSTLTIILATTLNVSGMNGTTTNKWNNVVFGAGGSITITLSSDISMSGNLTLTAGTSTTVNGLYNVNIGGSIVGITQTLGTSTFVMNGTGATTSGWAAGNPLTFNSPSGTITISGTLIKNGSTALTYTAGTMIVTGSTLDNGAGNCTLNTAGMTWNNVTFYGTITVTLTSNLNCSGTLTLGGTTLTTTINGLYNINTYGTVTIAGSSSTITGTATLVLAALVSTSQTWTSSFQQCNLAVVINAAGTVVFSGLVVMGKSITYTAGTVTTTGSTLYCNFNSSLGTTAVTYVCSSITWNNIQLFGAVTCTLSQNLNCSGTLSVGSLTNATILTGNTINCASLIIGSGNLSSGTISGTTVINLNASGALTVAGTITTGSIANSITFSSITTITGTIPYKTGTITNSGGTVTTTGSTLSLLASTTLATNGITWNNITIASGITITQTTNNNLSGTLTTAGTTTINGAFTLTGFHWEAGTTTLAGSSNVTFSGGTSIAPNTINAVALTVNKTNTLTIAGVTTWTVTTFTNTAGTISATGTLTITGSRTFAGATTWGGWDVSGAPTLTLNALQSFTGILNLGSSVTFAGTSGFTAYSLKALTLGTTITLVSTKTYTVTNVFAATGTLGNVVLFNASTPASRAILTIQVGADSSAFYANATDIDSSAGQTVNSTNGVFSNTLNWLNVSSLAVSYSFVN